MPRTRAARQPIPTLDIDTMSVASRFSIESTCRKIRNWVERHASVASRDEIFIRARLLNTGDFNAYNSPDDNIFESFYRTGTSMYIS